MGAVRAYFRTHRWQGRLLTGSTALLVGASASVLLYGPIRDYRILRDLASPDAQVRENAAAYAVAVAADSPATVRRFNRALDASDDRTFLAIVGVLQRLGAFNTPQRPPRHVDRMRAIEIRTTRAARDAEGVAATRAYYVRVVALSSRDNRHVRDALASAVKDHSPRVRSAAALLAGRLRDTSALRTLLADPDPNVAAAAALDSGLAGATDLAEDLTGLLTSAKHPHTIAGAAYALAKLRPLESSEGICRLLENTRDPMLRNRLLHVATLLANSRAATAVRTVLDATVSTGQVPGAMTLLAAGKLRIAAAGEAIRAVLTHAAEGDTELTQGQALAAVQSADALGLAVRTELNTLCGKYWGPRTPLLLLHAVRALGRQNSRPQGTNNAATALAAVRTLRLAASFHATPASQPAGGAPATMTTPLPSAAAAAALWKLAPTDTYLAQEDPDANDPGIALVKVDRDASAYYVHLAASSDATIAGDYLAWEIGRTEGDAAFRLGLGMVPQRGARGPARVYNHNIRAAGAMLLALGVRTEEHERTAVRRIRSRLVGGRLGGETDLVARGSYQCALLLLGDTTLQKDVRALLQTAKFPHRRAATALCAVGDPHILDWLLGDLDGTYYDIVFLLINTGIGDVLAATAPQLPRIDPAADPEIKLWQARILQDDYIIHRGDIRFGLEH